VRKVRADQDLSEAIFNVLEDRPSLPVRERSFLETTAFGSGSRLPVHKIATEQARRLSTLLDKSRTNSQNRPLVPIDTVINPSVRLTYLVASLQGRRIRSGQMLWGGSHPPNRPAAQKDG
jgi:hypothetical protein